MKILSALLVLTTCVCAGECCCPPSVVELFVAPNINEVEFTLTALDTSSHNVEHHYKMHNVVGYKGGLRTQLFIGDHWFFKGFADYGLITSGSFSLTSTGASDTTAGINGTEADGSIAAGYLFYPGCNWQIGPTIGWSYSCLLMRTRGATSGGSSANFEKIKTQWGGPLLGVETNYCITPCLTLFGGYEFHLTYSRFQINVPSSATNPSSQGHLRYLVGNLVHVGTSYAVSKCWHVGLDLSGAYYSTSRTGNVSPPSLTGVESNRQVTDAKIGTAAIQIFAGVHF